VDIREDFSATQVHLYRDWQQGRSGGRRLAESERRRRRSSWWILGRTSVQLRYTYIETGSRGVGLGTDWQSKRREGGGAAGGY
jgi:hypothetical protein